MGRGEGSAGAKGNKHAQTAPPKDEHEKENINIVFIGHVGESCGTQCCVNIFVSNKISVKDKLIVYVWLVNWLKLLLNLVL